MSLGASLPGGLVAVEAETALALAGLSRRDQARIAELALPTTVRRLEGCLRYLPVNLRRVLELLAGVGVPRALGPEAVAEQLNISLAKVSRLQRLALRRLRMTARSNTCGVATQAATDPFAYGLAALVGEEGGPAGGVEAARYATSPSAVNKSSQGGHSLLGISNPALEGGAMLLIIACLGGLLLGGLLFADDLWPWPIHREWRSRWIHHHPWNWHH
jgi:hypothetical protein